MSGNTPAASVAEPTTGGVVEEPAGASEPRSEQPEALPEGQFEIPAGLGGGLVQFKLERPWGDRLKLRDMLAVSIEAYWSQLLAVSVSHWTRDEPLPQDAEGWRQLGEFLPEWLAAQAERFYNERQQMLLARGKALAPGSPEPSGGR